MGREERADDKVNHDEFILSATTSADPSMAFDYRDADRDVPAPLPRRTSITTSASCDVDCDAPCFLAKEGPRYCEGWPRRRL
jgi:hypothetical protein